MVASLYCIFLTFRGGILEPEGTVEIKFKQRDLEKVICRIDSECAGLSDSLLNPDLTEDAKADLNLKLSERLEYLHPIYHQVAVHFADLHDTPGRMEEKGVISVRMQTDRTLDGILDKVTYVRVQLSHQPLTLFVVIL